MAERQGLSLAPDTSGPPSIVEGYGIAAGGDRFAQRVAADMQRASSARLFQEQQVFVRSLFNTRAYYLPDLNFPSGTSRAFVNATRPKIQTAVALLMPIVCPPGGDSFTIDPDTDSIDPTEAMALLSQGMDPEMVRDRMFQAAGKKSDRLTSKIRKGLDSTQFSDKTLRFLWDMCWAGTGIMMGPMKVPNSEAQPPSVASDESAWDAVAGYFGLSKKQIADKQFQQLIDVGLLDEVSPAMEVISPLDFYPDPSSYTIEGSRFGIWRMVLGKPQIMEMLSDPTFKKDVIEKLLEDSPNGVWEPVYWETAINSLNKQPQMTVPNGRFTVLQWWGYMSGKDLHEAGVTTIPTSKFNERSIVQIWTCGHRTIKVEVSELHTERLPFYLTPYSYAPNSMWGIGPAEMMFDAQDAINGCERSIMDNMAICSGPQVTVDLDQLADPSSILEIKPRKFWAVRSKVGATTEAIKFWVPDCRIAEILEVQRNEERLSQEQTGLPNFLMGQPQQGTHNRTLGGANLQFNTALTPLKSVVYNIENNLIVPLIRKYIRFFQMFSKDPLIKGNFKVNVNGVKGLLARESLIQSMGDLMQALQGMPDQMKRMKMSNFFDSYMRYSGLVHEDLVYSDAEYQQLMQKEQEEAQKNQAYSAGIQASVQATPKMRAEIPLKDVIVELVKCSPENSDLRLAYMDFLNKALQIETPELKQAMEEQKQIHHMQNLNMAHESGHMIAQREHEPLPNQLKEHPALQPPMPPQPGGGK